MKSAFSSLLILTVIFVQSSFALCDSSKVVSNAKQQTEECPCGKANDGGCIICPP